MVPASPPVWRVGAIMNEPLPVVLDFCAWYLSQGADELVICFDNPGDPAIAHLEGHPKIHPVRCDQEFWQQLGVRADAVFVRRQNAALTWIYGQYDDGWLLNVDADEFVHLEGRGIDALLAELPDDLVSARIITAERIVADEQSAALLFRRPMEYRQRKRVYGEDRALFGPRRHGLVGHPQGKSFVRCGVEGLKLRQHWPMIVEAQPELERVFDHKDTAYLLHMIGADYEIWRSKLNWRSASAGFTGPLAERVMELRALEDPEPGLRDLFRRLHCAGPDLLARMRARDLIVEVDLGLGARREAVFGAGAAVAGI